MGPERIRSSTQGAVKYLSISFSCWPSWPVGQRSQDYAESRNLRRCSAIGPHGRLVCQLGIIRNSALSNLCRARHKFDYCLRSQTCFDFGFSPTFWLTGRFDLLGKMATAAGNRSLRHSNIARWLASHRRAITLSGRWFPRLLQLSPGVPIFAAAPRPQAQPAVVPQLALRTETMRCLNESDQKGDPDRAQPGNLFEELTGRMFPAFRQQLLPRFLPCPHQKVELLIGLLSPATHAGFPQFFQPGGAVARGIDLLAGAG